MKASAELAVSMRSIGSIATSCSWRTGVSIFALLLYLFQPSSVLFSS
ncbi:hypothetical protein DAI22_11g220950 [Oryza sativa Japonica Group]|nr:hypothetical protein DAI22_11g220950 [Oryza sativa Japonica Group]